MGAGTHDGSLERWLDGLKLGYAQRFAGAFAELGVEDVSDLGELADSTGSAALGTALEARGAKTVQVQKIYRALGELTGRCAAPQRRARTSPSPPPKQEEASGEAPQEGWWPPVVRPEVSDIPGMVHLGGGAGPRLYMVHGFDGDISGAGCTYRGIAPHLFPCHTSALVFDEEAAACGSLEALALLYNGRVMADAVRHAHCPIVLVGYSLGCVLAHRMALQLQANFTEVVLLLFGFEVNWPPGRDWQRAGGYGWLGGGVEAALLAARACPGGGDWAAKEAQALAAADEPPDAAEVQQRAFAEVVSRGRRCRLGDFQAHMARAGRNMELLHGLAMAAPPPAVSFAGPALLVLAPESPECGLPARMANAKHCESLEVVYGAGTHFNMLQGEQALATAGCVLGFLVRRGYLALECEGEDGEGAR